MQAQNVLNEEPAGDGQADGVLADLNANNIEIRAPMNHVVNIHTIDRNDQMDDSASCLLSKASTDTPFVGDYKDDASGLDTYCARKAWSPLKKCAWISAWQAKSCQIQKKLCTEELPKHNISLTFWPYPENKTVNPA